MSLYYEAARLLESNRSATLSQLKQHVYTDKSLKSSRPQIYGLCSEGRRWSGVLAGVIERAGLLEHERKLTPALALLLVHDLLLNKKGLAARKDHTLTLCINRHKARLAAELTRARVKAGFASVDAWRQSLLEAGRKLQHRGATHPRWLRVNTLVTSVETECNKPGGVFQGWQRVSTLQKVLDAVDSNQQCYWIDKHVPSLLALPPGSESILTKTAAYRNGHIILQDKASCFPAYLLFSILDPGTGLRENEKTSLEIIDACAAPGNKTTHLAALAMESYQRQPQSKSSKPRITAVERDKNRARTLVQMVHTAGADRDGLVTCLQGQDFSRLNPSESRWTNVTALLLDPSCSGSGIVGRDQGDDGNDNDDESESLNKLILPQASSGQNGAGIASKKGKEDEKEASIAAQDETDLQKQEQDLQKRLQGLHSFQLSLVCRALDFRSAHTVVYSTCSIHAAENEDVVVAALQSRVAQSRGWRVLSRERQIDGMRRWHVRGEPEAVLQALNRAGSDQDASVQSEDSASLRPEEADEATRAEAEAIAQACIRCNKGTTDGTMGFFAVCFVRDGEGAPVRGGIKAVEGRLERRQGETQDDEDEEGEFEGFSD